MQPPTYEQVFLKIDGEEALLELEEKCCSSEFSPHPTPLLDQT